MFNGLKYCFLLLLLITGCETTSPPPVSNLDRRDGQKIAGWLEQQDAGRLATLGGGKSMEPLYFEDTILLLAPIAYEDLEVGMVVAYRNREGFIVVHQLIRKEKPGWSAKGTNNPRADSELVTPDNLIGVVYGSIYAGGEG